MAHPLDILPDQPFSEDELENRRLMKALDQPDEFLRLLGVIAANAPALMQDETSQPLE